MSELYVRKKSDLGDIAFIFVKLNTRRYKYEAVGISSQAFLPVQVADSTIIGLHGCIAVWSSKMQEQNRWHSVDAHF